MLISNERNIDARTEYQLTPILKNVRGTPTNSPKSKRAEDFPRIRSKDKQIEAKAAIYADKGSSGFPVFPRKLQKEVVICLYAMIWRKGQWPSGLPMMEHGEGTSQSEISHNFTSVPVH